MALASMLHADGGGDGLGDGNFYAQRQKMTQPTAGRAISNFHNKLKLKRAPYVKFHGEHYQKC